MEGKKLESLMKAIFFLASCLSILSIILITFFIFSRGLPFISQYGLKNFLLGRRWAPTDNPPSFGILPMLLGSFYVTLGAGLLGIPIGILTAIYLAEFASPRAYRFLKPLLNLMAGIPSIVYGFFALSLLVPLVRSIFGSNGMNILTASILLALMILPTIVSLSEASIRAVDPAFYEASIALGASHEESVFKVVLGHSRSGIMASIVLGLGRAIGETMAVILVAGNQGRMPKGLLSGVRTLTTNIVMEMSYAAGQHREALIATASVLFFFILLINASFLILKRRERNE